MPKGEGTLVVVLLISCRSYLINANRLILGISFVVSAASYSLLCPNVLKYRLIRKMSLSWHPRMYRYLIWHFNPVSHSSSYALKEKNSLADFPFHMICFFFCQQYDLVKCAWLTVRLIIFQALRTLFNVAHRLHNVLGPSWVLVSILLHVCSSKLSHDNGKS